MAGGAHAAVIADDGTIWTWGYNGQGQLGQINLSYSTTPIALPAPFPAVAVTAGFKRTLALNSSGKVWTWGGNANDTTPQQLPIENITKIAMGAADEALLLDSNGRVWSWSATAQRPVKMQQIEDAAGIGIGISSFFVFTFDCSLLAWGKNQFGQLGDGTNTSLDTPTTTNLFACLSAISADNYTVALDAEGNVWTWGYNHEGQLGDSTTQTRHDPQRINSLANIVAIDSDQHTLALKADGTVWAWGKNNFGQLGDGTTTDRNEPVQVAGLHRVQAIAAGAMFSLAVKADGSVWAWGRNNYGQLGNGTQENSLLPIHVQGFEGIGFLSLHSSHPESEIPPVFFTADPTKGTAPLKISFTPILHPQHPPLSLEWDFGDGEISSAKTTSHTYENPGSYIVTLTTHFAHNVSRESMKQVVIKSPW